VTAPTPEERAAAFLAETPEPDGDLNEIVNEIVAQTMREQAERMAGGPVTAATPDTACDCYPGGVSPETYEGPQEWCEVHGQARSVLIQHRDAARALVDTLRAEVAAAERRGADAERARLVAAVKGYHDDAPVPIDDTRAVPVGDVIRYLREHHADTEGDTP
jgi:hypothetical protein